MTDLTITLEQFAERVVTPAMLALCGLPDSDEGRVALDVLVEAALADG